MFITLTLSIAALWSTPVPLPSLEPDGILTLSVRNLRHGLDAIFTLEGATPGRSCGLIVSLTGAGPTTINTGPCPILTLSLSPTLYYLGTVNADAIGKAIWTKTIPTNAGGRTVWAQGVSFFFCETSNLLNQVVS